jgi:hypothetical protein
MSAIRKRRPLLGRHFATFVVTRVFSNAKCRIFCFKCGRTKTVWKANLPKMQSCGCALKELISKKSTIHGHTRNGFRSPTFKRYLGMHARCEQRSHHEYKHYGKAGIKVCLRWSGKFGFVHFLKDLGELPSPQHTLSRQGDSGNYKPGNVSWELPEHQYEQARIKRERTMYFTSRKAA